LLDAKLDAALLPLLESFSGEVGIALYRFGDGFRYERNARAPRLAASLIKLFVLLEVLAQVDEGKLELKARYPLRSGDVVGGNGVLQLLDAGLTPTLRDLLSLMIAVSDNTATNILIDLVGEDAVNRHCEALGLTATRLVGKLSLPEARYNEAQRRGERNRTSPSDVLELLVALAEGRWLSGASSALALKALEAQLYTEALARYLPTDPELDEHPVTLASKSGCLRGVWHDAGIVLRSGEPYCALVVMTTGSRDRRFGWEQEGMMLIARVAERVYQLAGRIGE
jgi:beta-lactamase class A